ncbi:MAG TPA: glutathione transferase, partial [Kofleriaceae bacterium]|nr:glutathione transferase [Kofleriaceae bacterium]
MLTLYGETLWESPYVYSVFVALREKGLAFDLKELDLQAGEQRQQPFAERSMVAKVPALDHDGFWLTESLAIVEYLDERFPSPEHPPVMPLGIEERARARQLAGVLRSGLPHLVAERPTSSIVFDPMRTPLGDAAKADAAKLINMVERLLPSDSTALFMHWTF